MREKAGMVVLFCLMLLSLAGCSLPAAESAAPANPGQASPTLDAAVAGVEATAQRPTDIPLGELGADGYPLTPEGVVHAFLSDYELEPEHMIQYLSSARQANLPKGGAIELLRFNGMMEGFFIEAAAVRPDPPGADVQAAVRVGGQEVRRNFVLFKENDHWVIDRIDTP